MKEGEYLINQQQFFEFPKRDEGEGIIFLHNYDKSNFIHHTAIIGSNVEIGKNNSIGAFCLIIGNTKIGDNNHFISNCVVGSEPEHRSFFGKKNKGTIIGNRNVFREFITITAGSENPTILEDDIFMLRGSHIGHDSRIMKNVTLSCNVLIGGHSLLGMHVNMGLGSVCHQYSRIPHYCMIGMNATVTKGFKGRVVCTYVGTPAKLLDYNHWWLKKLKWKNIEKLNEEFKLEKIGS